MELRTSRPKGDPLRVESTIPLWKGRAPASMLLSSLRVADNKLPKDCVRKGHSRSTTSPEPASAPGQGKCWWEGRGPHNIAEVPLLCRALCWGSGGRTEALPIISARTRDSVSRPRKRQEVPPTSDSTSSNTRLSPQPHFEE